MNKYVDKVLYKFMLVFLMVVANAYSQNSQTSKVTYKVSVNTDLEKADLNKSSKDKIKAITNAVKLIECQLYFDGSSSLFQQVKKMGLEDDYTYKLASVFIRGTNYINIKEKKRILVKHISDEVFNISMPYNKYDWEITKETKVIGNYVCYKAIASKEVLNPITKTPKKNKVVAWFTPQIAAPFGPNGIDGLPGLILETTTNNISFYATKIEINSLKQKTIQEPENGKEITEEAYLKLVHSKFSSLFDGN